MKKETEKGENRKALPRFFLTMLASLLVGGVLGVLVGMSRIFNFESGWLGRALDGALRAVTPWGIPVTSAGLLGACLFLYRSAARRYVSWEGGDEDENAEAAEHLLSWVLLLSGVQLLVDLFFMTAIAVYELENLPLLHVGIFLLSCGLVIFVQQKTVDLERRMNPEKRGSVYDSKFQKKWLESCDELERRQIGEASYRAFQVTGRVCMGLWLVLTVLGMVLRFSVLPVFILLVVWGVMQVTYALACIRLSRGEPAAR